MFTDRATWASALALGLGAMIVTTAMAEASPYGTWLRPSTGGKLRAFKCGGGLGLKVTASKDRKKVGKTIICGARQTAPNVFTGRIYNIEDGNTYAGKVEIRGNSMHLSGCAFAGLFCKTETWRRIN